MLSKFLILHFPCALVSGVFPILILFHLELENYTNSLTKYFVFLPGILIYEKVQYVRRRAFCIFAENRLWHLTNYEANYFCLEKLKSDGGSQPE